MLQMQHPLPLVSILTPTYNRQRFMPQLLRCVMNQDYPHDLLQWIIVTGDEEKTPAAEGVEELKVSCSFLEIFPTYRPGPQPIGIVRNQALAYASGDIMVNFDDDDYYGAGYIRHAVACVQNSREGLAGMSQRVDYELETQIVYEPFSFYAKYSPAGNMAFSRDYLRDNRFGESRNSEERTFTRKFTTPMVQMDMLAVGVLHGNNSGNTNRRRERSTLSLNDLIPDEPSREFYRTWDL